MQSEEFLHLYHSGQRNFREASLRRISLAQLDLVFSDFSLADLRQSDLTGAVLVGANFTAALLNGADLSYANLISADLIRAQLTSANLTRVLLSGANLQGANLSCAHLHEASLPGADLTGANLAGADLSGANLRHANLTAANLWGANLQRADLEDANLNGTTMPDGNQLLAYLPLPEGETLVEYEGPQAAEQGAEPSPWVAVYDRLTLYPGSSMAEARSISPECIPQPEFSPPQNMAQAKGQILLQLTQRQGNFELREQLLQMYGQQCMISGCNLEPLLELVYIVPHLDIGTHTPDNALLLRSDLRTLFELHWLTITPYTFVVRIAPSLRNSAYAEFDRRVLRLPDLENYRPNSELLLQHWQQCLWIEPLAADPIQVERLLLVSPSSTVQETSCRRCHANDRHTGYECRWQNCRGFR